MDFEQGFVIIHAHDLALDWIKREWLLTKGGAICREMLHVQISICLKEMEKSEHERHKTLTHSTMLRLELLLLGFGGPQEDLLRCLGGNHRGEFGCDVEAMPYTTEIV